ncbi:MAG: type VI secretion system-associated FHA domain protein TagH [Siculibacillus sp.]|nr:type VI secretion system-associated FHA domain protein TagH [Siculibacillus sp.]
MALVLRIENETTLPDGGPTEFRISGRRGIDIGRDPYLDWTLPDSTRFISSRHCEVRWADGGYVLHDVSTNGTFVNGSDRRLNGPHRLRNGDRLLIGNYIIVVEDDQAGEAPSRPPRPEVTPRPVAADEDLWAVPSSVPPGNRQEFVIRPETPRKPDFLDQVFDVPTAAAPPPPKPEWPRDDAPPRPEPRRPQPPANFGELPTPPVAEVPAARRPPPPDHVDPPRAAPVGEVRPEPVAPPPRPSPRQATPMAAANAGVVDLLAELAKGAGIPPEVLAQRDPADLMQDVGAMLRIVVEQMMALLAARSETKRAMRSTQHTMVGPTDNNPLKFSPTPDEAIRLLLGPPLRSYLDGRSTLIESFGDLSNHQLRTFAAIQQALKILIEDLEPERIEKEAGPDSALGSLMGNRKARFWDLFVTKWRAKVAHNEDGMIGRFMLYFSDCYDRLGTRSGRR